jgi:NADH-quinone oxidoreductase subunit L
MFHLVTHACFKGLLFLGAGSVMHGMEHGHQHVTHDSPRTHDEEFNPQDMRFMGGLRKKMPTTYWTYLFATFAIAGVVPFAGFWSKDEILLDSWKTGIDEGLLSGYVGFVLLLIAAAFTAFYMWRQVCLVFLGDPRHPAAEHAQESPAVMIWPLMALGILSLVIGFINVPSGLPVVGWIFGKHQFTSFLEHAVVYAHAGSFNLLMATFAVALALGAIYVARSIYNDRVLQDVERDPLELDLRTRELFRLSNAKLYWDEAYFSAFVYPYQKAARFLAEQVDWRFWHDYVHEQLIVRPFQAATRWLTGPVDKGVIDRAFNRLGDLAKYVAARLRRIQTGYVHVYALSVLFGALLALFLILFPVIRELLGL